MDAYRIGVRISMADGVSAVLATLGHEFLGLDRRVVTANSKIEGLHRVIMGLGMLTVGGALLKSFITLAEYGGRVVDELAKMRAMGIDAATAAQNMADAFKLASSVMSTTPSGAARMISELRSVLENSGQARTVAPYALQFAAVLRAANPNLSEAAADRQVIAWLKGLDIQGAFINRKTGKLDPQKAAQAFAMMESAVLLTQGLLTGQGFYQFTRMAGPAASLTQLRDYLRQTVEVMLGLGRTGGRGMQMATTKLLGGNLTKAQAEELVAVGAVKQSDIKKEFGHYTLRPGALVGYSDLATKGIDYWFSHDMVPLLKKAEHGKGMAGLIAALKKSGAMDAKTADLVSLMTNLGAMPVTAERLFAFLLMNQAQVEKFKQQFDKALKTNAGQVMAAQSWTMNVQNFEAAWTGLLEALGTPAAKVAIPAMRDVADAMKALTGFLGAHPEAAKDLMAITLALGSFLTVIGTSLTARAALGALTKALPGLAMALGPFAAGGEAAGALALLTTGLPELAISIAALSEVVPVLRHSLDVFIGEDILGLTPAQEAKQEAKRKEMLKKGREWGDKHFWPHLDPFNWNLHWPNLRVPGQPLIGPGAPNTALIGPHSPTAAPAQHVTNQIDVHAPLNVTIDGSLLGTDYATLDFYMQGWIRKHGQDVGNAVAAHVQKQQDHNRRRAFHDQGQPLGFGGL